MVKSNLNIFFLILLVVIVVITVYNSKNTNPFMNSSTISPVAQENFDMKSRSKVSKQKRPDKATYTKVLSKFVNIYSTNVYHEYTKGYLLCRDELIPIFLHDKNGMSKVIRNENGWEKDVVAALDRVGRLMDFHFIDIGCHVGVHTLNMAYRGYDVIAVDAEIEHVKRLYQTVHLNHFTDRVVVLHNAMEDSHGLYGIIGNQMDYGIARTFKKQGNGSSSVNGIYMDDLIPLLKHKNVLIKIDIEGNEINAFRQSKTLFESYNVFAIFIEWSKIDRDSSVNNLVKYFLFYKLKPYTIDGKPLNKNNMDGWPENILWKL